MKDLTLTEAFAFVRALSSYGVTRDMVVKTTTSPHVVKDVASFWLKRLGKTPSSSPTAEATSDDPETNLKDKQVRLALDACILQFDNPLKQEVVTLLAGNAALDGVLRRMMPRTKMQIGGPHKPKDDDEALLCHLLDPRYGLQQAHVARLYGRDKFWAYKWAKQFGHKRCERHPKDEA